MYDGSQATIAAVGGVVCGVIILIRWWTLSEFEARQSVAGAMWDFPNRMVAPTAIIVFSTAALISGWPHVLAIHVVAGALLVLGVVGSATTRIFWRPRWLLPRRLQAFIRQRIAAEPTPAVQRQTFVERVRGLPASVLEEPNRHTHHVLVFHVGARPDAERPDDRVAHYYALCDRDDLPGHPRATAEEAFADARAHSTDVEPDVHEAIDPASLRGRFIIGSAGIVVRATRRSSDDRDRT